MVNLSHGKPMLRSRDGRLVQLPLKVLQSSTFLRNIPKELFQDGPVPIDSINQNILEKAVSWCDYHINDDSSVNQERENLHPQEWEQEASHVDQSILFDLILAANFLDLNTLLKYCCTKAAEMINKNCLHSLDGIPDEVQLQIAEQIRPYILLKAAQAGIVPMTPKLQKRAQHAYVWATIFNPDDFSILETFFEKESNAFLIGPGVKYLYNGIYETSVETHAPMHLFFGWPGKGPKFNQTMLKGKPYFGHTIRIRNLLVNVQLCGELHIGKTPVPDIGKLVDSKTLKAPVIYFRDPEFDLHEIKFGHAGFSSYGATLNRALFPPIKEGFVCVTLGHYGEITNEERRHLTDEQLQLPWHSRMWILQRKVGME
jgi:S-phase kinase-associated protein 1